MRGLTLQQPHATLAVCLRHDGTAEKPFETRTGTLRWFPLGELVIHAGLGRKYLWQIGDPNNSAFRSALQEHGYRSDTELPFGCALGVATVIAVWTVATDGCFMEMLRGSAVGEPVRPIPSGRAFAFGFFGPGRTVIELADVRTLRRPFPMRGRQGLFTLTAEEEAGVRALLR